MSTCTTYSSGFFQRLSVFVFVSCFSISYLMEVCVCLPIAVCVVHLSRSRHARVDKCSIHWHSQSQPLLFFQGPQVVGFLFALVLWISFHQFHFGRMRSHTHLLFILVIILIIRVPQMKCIRTLGNPLQLYPLSNYHNMFNSLKYIYSTEI